LHEADPKTFDSISPKERPKVARLVNVVFQRHFSGPLPPPEVLAHYNEVVPGAAERILTLTEEQSAYRRRPLKLKCSDGKCLMVRRRSTHKARFKGT
jgi:uncharacterized membrane protein